MLALALGCASATADLATDVREAASQINGHPRLFITPAQAAQLPERAKTDEHTIRAAEAVIAKAERLLDEAPVTRELQGRRMLRVSRQALDRMATLSLAWHLSQDRRFVDRASTELHAVAAFENWNPSHFLDTAEMTLGVAIAYDWLHAELDEETRQSARQAIFEKGLTPALASDRHWWMRTSNNWNQVCHGGLVAGAIVLLDHERDAALRMIESAVRHIPNAMESYSPVGAYPEGPSYWSYGTNYNVIFLAALQSALGTTFGLDEMQGFAKTGAFPILTTGPSGLMFNFADGRPNRGIASAIYWLANHYDRPEWTRHEDEMIAASSADWKQSPPSWLLAKSLLLWRDPASTEATTHDLPLHWTSQGTVPISVHREAWDREDAVFVGVKAGPPTASHGHMDIGSFVLDADGVRWAHDLGAENYHQIESRGISLWNDSQDGGRWRIFRNNNLSHNTLVIDGELQHAAGNAPMARFSADPAFPHSVVDMTPVYQSQVDRAHRGIALLPGGSVLVRDHLTGLRPGAEVRWAMVTKADVGDTGNPTLNLQEDDKTLTLSIHGDHDLTWHATDLTTPPNEWDSPNEGFTMVTFTATAPESGTLDLTVVLQPGSRAAPKLEDAQLARPFDWSPASQ